MLVAPFYFEGTVRRTLLTTRHKIFAQEGCRLASRELEPSGRSSPQLHMQEAPPRKFVNELLLEEE